jgi:mevalonate kinase
MTELLSQASAPGKVILLGEHTVVYGKPAIAIPVSQLRTEALIEAFQGPAGEIWIDAPAVHIYKNIQDIPATHPLRVAVEITLAECKRNQFAGILIRIHSTLPIAGGMGSGASVSCAIVRALSTCLIGHPFDLETTNRLVFEVEKLHHGNPSGVDNTVITYEQPVLYQKEHPVEIILVGQSLEFLIADTGISSRTAVMVDGVRKRFDKNKARYELVLDEIGKLVEAAKMALQVGDMATLADSMNNNHSLLQELEVSCYSLDRLVRAARNAGAMAAKLTGAGGGGSMIALISNETHNPVKDALLSTGAVRVIPFTLLQG